MSAVKLIPASGGGSVSLAPPNSTSGADVTVTMPTASQGLGKILQVVQNSDTTSTGSFSLSSNSTFYDYTNMNVAITPTSASSKMLISFTAFGEGDDEDHNYQWRIKRAISGGSTTNITAPAAGNRKNCMGMITTGYHGADSATSPSMLYCINYLDSPATTSAITYTLQLNVHHNTKNWYFNRTVNDDDNSGNERGMSYITVMEIAG